ncbi:CopG family transcriptional regulator [Candidatus Woesearchaeota archaeon]|nr:CopG family transcriptional regulator [Candidatus Woesearchaeota archaeon]
MSESNITTISIPKPLAEKIKKRCEGTGFNSVSSYVTYVLRQVLSNMEQETENKEQKEAFSEEDEKKVKQRLRSLGYLD